MKLHLPIWELERHCTPDILAYYAAAIELENDAIDERTKEAQNKKKVTRKRPGRRPKGRK